MKPARFALLGAIALLFLSPTAQAAEVQWRSSLEQAEKEVLQTGRPLLLQMTADWCVYCHKMIRETYSDPRIAAYVNANFVPVQLDVDKNKALVKSLRVRSFPSTAIVSADFQRVHKITGFKKASPFSQQLQAIVAELPKAAVRTASMNDPVAAPVGPVQTPTQPVAPPVPNVVTEPQPAFGGVCLVSLLNDQKLVVGSAQLSTRHRGRELRFASEDSRNLFLAAPHKYWPAADGNCPVSSHQSGRAVAGKPSLGLYWEKQMWFFSSNAAQEAFIESPKEYQPAQVATPDVEGIK